MRPNIYIKSGLLGLLSSILCTLSFAQTDLGIFELLAKEDIPELELHADLTNLLENKLTGNSYTAQLNWETATGVSESWKLKVSVRGKYRRMTCDFPPLRLKFSKDQLAVRGFNAHNKLKLVTHCLDERGEGQQNLLKEFLAYQLYQELTPYSYRVQLVRIRYIDSSGKLGNFRRYAFVIEDTDDMAERIGGQECDHCINPDPTTLVRKAENLHALFQFFIGNTDFNLPMVRNLKLVTLPNAKVIPVGYDFDFSGFVNAAYAVPSYDLGQSHLRDRVFLGLYVDDAILRSNLQHFVDKKETLFSMVRNFRLLKRSERDDMISYLQGFYDEIELVRLNSRGVYQSLRQAYPAAVPAGGRQEHYRVGK